MHHFFIGGRRKPLSTNVMIDTHAYLREKLLHLSCA